MSIASRAGRSSARIVVPSTLPYLVAGMKVGFGLALKVSVVAEIFGVTSGIGYVMNYSREILATQMVFVWAIVMILVMTATDKLVFDAVSRHLSALAGAVKLDVAGVGKDYLIPVIDSVSFAAEAGEFVCVLGPNGCGKTTLLRIVGGIEPATRGRRHPRRAPGRRRHAASAAQSGSCSRKTGCCRG